MIFVVDRYYGRKIFHMLMSYQEFDRMLSKHLPANTLKSVSDIVENLRVKVRILDFRYLYLHFLRSVKSKVTDVWWNMLRVYIMLNLDR